MRMSVSLDDFVRLCIESAGGLVDLSDPELAQVMLPPDLRNLGEQEVTDFALAPGALERHPNASPLFPGSPQLDTLISFAARRGQVTRS
jgi:hypothetical protein